MPTTGTLFKLSGIIDIKTNSTTMKLKEVDAAARKTSKGLAQTGQASNSASSSAEGLGGSLGGLSASFISITAIIAVATKALMEYGRVQTEVAQLGTLFVGNTKQANELAAATAKMSDALGIDKVQGMAAAYKVVSTQLGTTTEEYEAATAAALKLARVGRAVGDSLDTTGVVNLLSTEIRAFGMNASDASKVADQLFKTIQLGNTDINQLASALPQVSAVAADVGVDFKELLAIIAGASKIIPDNIQITNSLTTALAQLQNGGAGVGKMFEQTFGTTFKDALAKTGSLTNLLVEFDNRLKASGSSLAEAFGVRGLKGIQALVTTSKDINASLAQIGDSSGLVNEGIRQLGEQGGLTMGQFKAEIKELLLTLGEGLSPILKGVVPILKMIVTAFKPLINIFQKVLTPVMERFKVVFTAVGQLFGMVAETVGVFFDALEPLTDLMTSLLKTALIPIKTILSALKPILNALKPVLQVIGYVLKGIGIVIKGIVWLAAKAIDLITKVATLGFGGTNYADQVTKAFSNGGDGDLNKADNMLGLDGGTPDQNSAAQEIGSNSAKAAGLSSASSIGKQQSSGGSQVTQYNTFTQPQASVEDVQRGIRDASRMAMAEIR